MPRPLTGAAKTAQARRILLDLARERITSRDHLAVADTVTLLREADRRTPRPRRFDQCDATCTTDCGHCKGAGRPEVVVTRHHSGSSLNRRDIPLLPLTGPQSPGRAW